ncbi:hypothetical protein CFC21_083363 [Triticum aestivum]|uniref:Uncharacterized protein n=5 Tax=Triticum TaxID=4564 RepID=A0A9R0XZM3_TRITD|nr:hypothetical protein TRIUR3_15846 [Triticum urartu]KAF7079060.1 hypothetical protein CFC21_083363 [Triticum aestivum]VAI45963.1 unnamed protein product [Triticum turgidum subsp. durum]
MDVSTVVAATCDVDVELVLPPPAPIEPDIPDFVLHPNVGIIPKTGHSVLNSSFAPKDIAIAVAKWGESPKRLIREMGLGVDTRRKRLVLGKNHFAQINERSMSGILGTREGVNAGDQNVDPTVWPRICEYNAPKLFALVEKDTMNRTLERVFGMLRPGVKGHLANLKRQKRTASRSQLRTVLNEHPATVRLSDADEVMLSLPTNNVSSRLTAPTMAERFKPCTGPNIGDMPKTRLSGMESQMKLRR